LESTRARLGDREAPVRAEIRRIREHRWPGDADPAFAAFVEHKRVALVGPARTVLGKRRGAVIEGCDVVVRLNDALDLSPFPPDLAADLGSRTDVLYCNPVVLKALATTPAATLATAGVQYVVCTNNSLNFRRDAAPHPAVGHFRVVHAASAALSRWLDGNWGRTGTIAILDLLTFGARRLFITGMTFFHGGGHLLAPADAQLHPLKNRDGTWTRGADGRGHDSFQELEIMRLLMEEFGDAIEVDEELAALIAGSP
jgi:Glycosyltransferase family 29 (sialyltransferase)